MQGWTWWWLGHIAVAGSVACVRPAIDGGEGTSSGAGDTSESSGPIADDDASPQEEESTVSNGTSGVEDSSADTGEPECGNGDVEPGEQCDGDEGCIDCMLVCGLQPAVTMALTAPTYLLLTPTPVPIPDGSGDFAVTVSNGVTRISATGEELWLNTASPFADWIDGLALTGGDDLWVMWTIGEQAPFHTRLTKHALDDGSILETIDLPGSPSSYGGAVHGIDDGDLQLVFTAEIDPATAQPVLERRTGDTGSSIWSTVIPAEPNPNGYVGDFANYLGVADDGAIFASGVRDDLVTHQPLVSKLDGDGGLLWQQLPFFDADSGIAAGAERPSPLADGGVAFVAWRQHSGAGAAVGRYPALDTRAIRLDADGELVWEVDLTEQVESGRVQLTALRALDDGRFVAAGALVYGTEADAWLAYLDADGNITCSTSAPHMRGRDTLVADLFLDDDGAMMVHGIGDSDDSLDLNTDVRWMTHLYPY